MAPRCSCSTATMACARHSSPPSPKTSGTSASKWRWFCSTRECRTTSAIRRWPLAESSSPSKAVSHRHNFEISRTRISPDLQDTHFALEVAPRSPRHRFAWPCHTKSEPNRRVEIPTRRDGSDPKKTARLVRLATLRSVDAYFHKVREPTSATRPVLARRRAERIAPGIATFSTSPRRRPSSSRSTASPTTGWETEGARRPRCGSASRRGESTIGTSCEPVCIYHHLSRGAGPRTPADTSGNMRRVGTAARRPVRGDE